MTDAPLSMAATAARVCLSAKQFGRVWRQWARDHGFPVPTPRPAVSRNVERLFWSAQAVDDWMAARRAALSDREIRPATSRAAEPVHPHHLARHRARLEQFMERNQP